MGYNLAMSWWQIVLAVAGGLVAGGLLLLTLVFWLLKHKLGSFLEEMIDAVLTGLSVPPFRVTLRAVDSPEWDHPQTASRVAETLAALGYRPAGEYEVEPTEVNLRGFCHPEARTYAAYYEHTDSGPVLDLVCCDEGDSLTVSNAPDTGMDRPPFAPLVRMEQPLPECASAMHSRLLEGWGARPASPTSADEFARVFTESYARVMDWRAERGGPTAEEIRRAAVAGGQDEPDDAAVERVQRLWRTEIADFVEERMREAYLEEIAPSAVDWEEQRDRVVFVHERADREEWIAELTGLLAPATGEEGEAAEQAWERERDGAERTVRETLSDAQSFRRAFAAMQDRLPADVRYEKLAELTGAWPGDVYLEPEVAEADC